MTSVEDHENKENTSTIEQVIIIDDDTSTKKKEAMIDTFFSPPKKKFKQDALPFSKLSKNEEALKKRVEKSPESNTQKDTNISPKSSDVIIVAERKLQAISKNQKSPNNVITPKNNKPLKRSQGTSPKIIQTPKTVTPAKNVSTPKNTAGANKSPKIVQTTKTVTPAKNVTTPKNTSGANKPKEKKQDVVLLFPKISKEDALKECEKEVQTSKNSPAANKPKEKKLDVASIFPKISKEDALKECEKEVQQLAKLAVEKEKENDSGTNGEEKPVMVNGVESCEPNEEPAGTPVTTPQSAEKKTSPVSKEERQRIKEEKELSKAARMKDMEEKRKKKEEEKITKQVEKEKRENERKEKERLREEEKKTREEDRKAKEEERRKKEEALKVEKEKKEQERKLEKEKRDAEKEKKEVERKVKEEQKKQEEEKKKIEDEAVKKKKEKEIQNFRSFFTKKKAKITKAPVVESYQRFKPFQPKENMSLAPLVRRSNINRDLLDKSLENVIPEANTYLQQQAIDLANNKKTVYLSRRKARRDLEELHKLEVEKTKAILRDSKRISQSNIINSNTNIIKEVVVVDDNSNDNVIDDDENEDNETDNSVSDKYLYASKLLQFSENTRPSYYGTWRKKSALISGRKPFALDTVVFNYEVDSDEEWIDVPGENLSDAAADEEEPEEKEDEDDQDGFFVPHGYLSDDEGIEDDIDDDDNTEEEGDKIPVQSTEKRDEDKLKLKVCTFEQRFQKKLKHRKPICIGITYTCSIEVHAAILNEYTKVALFKRVGDDKEEEDLEHSSPSSAASAATKKSSPSSVSSNNVAMTVPVEAMPLLIQLVHGNVKSTAHMAQALREYWPAYIKENQLTVRAEISKRQIVKEIQAIATRAHNKELKKICYVVNDDVIKKHEHHLGDLKLGKGLPSLLPLVNNTSSLLDSSEPMEVKNSKIPLPESSEPMEIKNSKLIDSPEPMEVKTSIPLDSTEPMEVKTLALVDSSDKPVEVKNIENNNQLSPKECTDTPMEVNS